jgi:hypothetical protein
MQTTESHMTTLNPETRKTYTDRSNARKAALRLIAAGTAPASQFDIVKRGDREFEIVFVPMAATIADETVVRRGGKRVPRTLPAIKAADQRAEAYVAPEAPIALAQLGDTAQGQANEASWSEAAPKPRRGRFLAGLAEALTTPLPAKPGRSEAPKPRTSGKRKAAEEAAAKGIIPAAPDFSANTHKPYRKRLAALVALIEARDLAGLRAVEMLPPRSTSPKALLRYQTLAIAALEAQAAPAPSTDQIEAEIAAASESTPA